MIGRAALALAALILTAAVAAPWTWPLPAGVAAPVVPADNPMSAAKVALGRRLFYDADLSIDGTMSRASCHEQKHAFADGNPTRPGVHGDAGRRNLRPTLAATTLERFDQHRIETPVHWTCPGKVESSLEVKGELDDEAVRLVATSGRTRREIAEDLGVGLSTLVRWISRSRDRLAEMPDAGPQADTAAELKRLRRENEILRQERDILKRATAFFAREGSR